MEFVVCGEALIDLVPQTGDGTSTFASSWQAQSAGSPMNTAIALARLGERTGFCGRLSTDALGRQMTAHIEANGLPTDRIVRTSDPTSLAVVSLDERGSAHYTFHFADTANFAWRAGELPELAADTWVHLGSLALVVEPSAEVLRAWAARHRGPISLDVNVRPGVVPDPAEYWRRIRAWCQVLSANQGVLKASDEDIEFLARGAGIGGNPVTVARGWVAEFGLSLAVVTFGADGAVAVLADGTVRSMPGRRVEVVDTIGAGDTFMAAFLRAHARDRADVDTALSEAVAASALVCTRPGAQPPTAAELAEWM